VAKPEEFHACSWQQSIIITDKKICIFACNFCGYNLKIQMQVKK
jgi:hypothetical protein